MLPPLNVHELASVLEDDLLSKQALPSSEIIWSSSRIILAEKNCLIPEIQSGEIDFFVARLMTTLAEQPNAFAAQRQRPCFRRGHRHPCNDNVYDCAIA